MAKKTLTPAADSGKTKPPLLAKGQDIESIPDTGIPMAQVFLLVALILAHTLTGYPMARILNRFTVADMATAYRRMWRWSIMMSVPGEEPVEDDLKGM